MTNQQLACILKLRSLGADRQQAYRNLQMIEERYRQAREDYQYKVNAVSNALDGCREAGLTSDQISLLLDTNQTLRLENEEDEEVYG